MSVFLVARAQQNAFAAHPFEHSDVTLVSIGGDDKTRPLVSRLASLLWSLTSLDLRRGDLVVVRLPEMLSAVAWIRTKFSRAKIVANVVAESGAAPSSLGLNRPVWHALARRVVSSMVKHSDGTIYVTRTHLQRLHPPALSKPTRAASNVVLRAKDARSTPRVYEPRTEGIPVRLVAVGSQNSPIKGHDLLIRALARLREEGQDLNLELVGDGRLHGELVALAAQLDVSEVLTFHGHLSDRDALNTVLDESDVFVMPSRSEGTPKALIEACSRGLCAIGSDIAGIAELLPSQARFEPDDLDALVECIRRTVTSSARMSEVARAGWASARQAVLAGDPAELGRFLNQIATSGG